MPQRLIKGLGGDAREVAGETLDAMGEAPRWPAEA